MSEAKIHLCFECGQKNRLPSGTEASALCGGCGKKLYPNLSRSAQASNGAKAERPNSANPKLSSKPMSGFRWLMVYFVGIVFTILIGSVLLSSGSNPTVTSTTSATTSTTWTPARADVVEPEITLVPEYLDPGIVWDRTGAEPIAPFEVVTRSGDNHFIKLVNTSTGQDAIAIFVRGGEPLEVDVPLGNYKMKWCSGETWFGEADRFGPDESCSTSNDIFNFRINGDYAEGSSVTLYTVSAGNMDTRRLDPSDF